MSTMLIERAALPLVYSRRRRNQVWTASRTSRPSVPRVVSTHGTVSARINVYTIFFLTFPHPIVFSWITLWEIGNKVSRTGSFTPAVILKCWAWRVAKTCCRFSRKLEIISEVKLSNCPFRWWSCFLSISLSQIWEKDAPFSVLKDSWPTIAPNRPAPCVLSE